MTAPDTIGQNPVETPAVVPSPLSLAVAQAFATQGPLASSLSGFAVRDGQISLALSIAAAIEHNEVLIAEAGTGIGKTFAYLVPAVLSGRRVMVSTGTRNLQDQLFNRDLPAVLAALGTGVSTALLKGRSNYVCRHHLARNLQEGRFSTRSDIAVLHRIHRFAQISRSGDRAEAPGIAEDAPAWAHATSTRESCLGQDCDHYDDCFVVLARRRALAADVVVINHHLFCADLALRDEGVQELLPRTDLLIFDEAHQLPDTATQFFGETVSTRQFVDFSRELMRTGHNDAPDAADWLALGGVIEQRLRELRLAAGQPRRIDEAELTLPAQAAMLQAWDDLAASLADPVALLTDQAERSRDIERLAVRGTALIAAARGWLSRDDQPPGAGDASGVVEPTDTSDVAHPDQHDALSEPPVDDPAVYWIDVGRQGLSLHRTPLAVSQPFRRQRLERQASWILTSATLAVSGRFDHFRDALGLDDARCESHDSPFDFARQAMLYVPSSLPEPRSASFATALVDATESLIRANEGRAFFLCTSLRMVDTVAGLLAARLSEPFTLLVQGSDSRDVLLNRFREADCPVLVGSASFWEGVDVVGGQLSLVIIDKLPFSPPDDPVIAARSRQLRRQGLDPFTRLHLTRTAMTLKQGAGRLIRSETDRGLLVIGDVRLAEKPYGRRLLSSLPPFRRTRDAQEALAFLQASPPPG